MKKLSDYQGNDAIELWADLLEPVALIFADKEIKELAQSKKAPLYIAKEALKSHPKEITEILLRIDDTPIDGLTVIKRLVNLIKELMESSEAKSFFNLQGQKSEDESSGSAMVSIEANEQQKDLSNTQEHDLSRKEEM